jgi:hypothetical protein
LFDEDEGNSPLNRLSKGIDGGGGGGRLRMDFPGVGIVTDDEDAVDMGAGVGMMMSPGGGGAEEDCERDGLDRPGRLCRPEGWENIVLVLVLVLVVLGFAPYVDELKPREWL